MDFYQIYRPLTATPLSWDDTHREYEPCEALKPYIRCFWGSSRPYTETETQHVSGIVIPDTCMDIIFNINFTENRLENSFCGINDASFCSADRNKALCDVSTFAIRFYAWSAVLFSEESMSADGRSNAFLKKISASRPKHYRLSSVISMCGGTPFIIRIFVYRMPSPGSAIQIRHIC